MNNKYVRKLLKSLTYIFRLSPFHPQWLIYRNNHKNLIEIAEYIHGQVLDVGCGNSEIKKFISENCNYIGLDYYYTSVEWYKSEPDLYGDAQSLPLKSESIETVVLLDVLEHLPGTEECLSEIHRVLTEKGLLILQVPYVYPVHDAPLDFYRWTRFGLNRLLEKYRFKVVDEKYRGNPFETSFLLVNIAMSKTILNWAQRRNPALICIVLLPPAIIINNLMAWLLTILTPADPIMPHSYRIIAEKY